MVDLTVWVDVYGSHGGDGEMTAALCCYSTPIGQTAVGLCGGPEIRVN